jgi:hypothetical protein
MNEATIGAISNAMQGRAMLKFERLDASSSLDMHSLRLKANKILSSGWRLGPNCLPSLEPPFEWDQFGRSFSFHLHAWEPLSVLLGAYDEFENPSHLELAMRIADSWVDEFFAPLASLPIDDAVEQALIRTDTMAWYDMSVGQRIHKLAYLTEHLARRSDSADRLHQFAAAMVLHHELLCRADFFKGHNNHGFYQAVGQLAAARRFEAVRGFSRYRAIGETRLNAILDASFFPSGCHKEHSPGYHYMVLAATRGAREAGLINDSSILTRLDAAEEALSWMVEPDGSLVNFGDTDHVPGSLEAAEIGVKGYLDAGYAFARFRGGSASSFSYLAQMTAFHSRTHKHSDHGSFVWAESGHRILVDPGRYAYGELLDKSSDAAKEGFWYADPKRQYVERSRSHNVVAIDDLDFPRKGLTPFGSGLKYAGKQGELVLFVSDFRPNLTWRYKRALLWRPGAFLIVLDWLSDKDAGLHEFTQWFQVHPEWAIEKASSGYDLTGEAGRLAIRSFLPEAASGPVVSGRDAPLQGWMSGSAETLTACPSICFRRRANSVGMFATLFTLSPSVEILTSHINVTLTSGHLRWKDIRGSHEVAFILRANDYSASYAETR